MRPKTLISTITGITIIGGTVAFAAPPPADWWDIGPTIRGKNYSVGMPLKPTPLRGGIWSFQFPYPTLDAGHVHYLTYPHGSLAGKRRIIIRYRIDAAPGVRFVSRERPDLPATLSLYFQRYGDNWRGRGRTATFRWYAPEAKLAVVKAGVTEIVASLSDPAWTPVIGPESGQDPANFAAAVDNADRLGFVFGSSPGRGHGVYATGPARFTLLEFRTE